MPGGHYIFSHQNHILHINFQNFLGYVIVLQMSPRLEQLLEHQSTESNSYNVTLFIHLSLNCVNNQDEVDEMTGEVKQLISNYNNIVSFTVMVSILHNVITHVM